MEKRNSQLEHGFGLISLTFMCYRESHCKTCDKNFTGAYRDHKDKDEHKVSCLTL